jgi:hypothetical protein
MKPRGKWVPVEWTDGTQIKTKHSKIEKLAQGFGKRAFEEKVWKETEGMSISVCVSGPDKILHRFQFESN